jgi:hypothetical protein
VPPGAQVTGIAREIELTNQAPNDAFDELLMCREVVQHAAPAAPYTRRRSPVKPRVLERGARAPRAVSRKGAGRTQGNPV